MSSAPITLVIADDHTMVARSLARAISVHGIQVVAQVCSGSAAIEAILALRPDFALVDLGMSPVDGLCVTRRVVTESSARVVIFSGNQTWAAAEASRLAGASGFVAKFLPIESVVEVIHAIGTGAPFPAAGVTGGPSPADLAALALLSARELEVLRLLAEGNRSHEVGTKLGISVRTVEAHRRLLGQKLGLQTPIELGLFAERCGLGRVP